MKAISAAMSAALVLVAASACAGATPDELAKRVGQTFAGYKDFWVWVTQREQGADGKTVEWRGRVYFKREKMFRLNVGQPPVLVEGTDGEVYWIYDSGQKAIEWCKLDEKAPVHILFEVFAAGEQMARALDRFFNVDSQDEMDFEYVTDKKEKRTVRAYRLTLSVKPEQLKEMRDAAGNKLAVKDADAQWTFIIDKEKSLPRRIEVVLTKSKKRYTFDLEDFHTDTGLNDFLFRMPGKSEGVDVREMKRGGK